MSEVIDFPSDNLYFIKIGSNNYYVRRLDRSYVGEVHLNKSYQYVFTVIDATLTESELSSVLSFLQYLSRKDS